MEITDPQAIRALAHPLRLDLLDALAATGPTTAAQCGRLLGVPQANCSFHLRQLAKYGFVEDAGPGQDRRERQWRVPDPRPTLRIPASSNSVFRSQLERVVVERETQAILDYGQRRDNESPAWRDKAGFLTAITDLSGDEVADIREKWKALLEPYLARTEASGQLKPGRRRVRFFMAATPLLDLYSGAIGNETDD